MAAMSTKIQLLRRLRTGSSHANIWSCTGEKMQSLPGSRGDRQKSMPENQAGKDILYYNSWYPGNKACSLTLDFFYSVFSSLSLSTHPIIIKSRMNHTINHNVYDFLLHTTFYHIMRIHQNLSFCFHSSFYR